MVEFSDLKVITVCERICSFWKNVLSLKVNTYVFLFTSECFCVCRIIDSGMKLLCNKLSPILWYQLFQINQSTPDFMSFVISLATGKFKSSGEINELVSF